MKPLPPSPAGDDPLRRQAKQRLRALPAGKPAAPASADPHRLLQELQIHQIELQLQNEELQQAKAAAETALERYTDLYEFSSVGYFTLSPEGTVILANLTGAALVGVDRSRLVGSDFGHVLASTHRPDFAAFLRTVFAGDALRSHDFELAAPSLPPRTLNIEARRLPDGLECRAVVADITARKHAEDLVRVSEIRYRRLFEAAHDGVLLVDPVTCKITDANPFMTTLLGYSREQLVGKELFEIGLLKDAVASREMFQQLKRNHQVRYEDLPLKSQLGRHQEVEVVANVYRENGQPVIQCNIRDITERKRAADLLRRNESLFTTLIAEAPVGIYAVDARLRLRQVNATALPVFKNIHPLIGRDLTEIMGILWSRAIATATVKRFRHTLKTGEPFQSPEFTQRRRDLGVVEIYDWKIQRVTLPAGEFGVVCFFDDLTEIRRAQQAQRRAEDLAAANLKLKEEIVQRRATEAALKKNERQARQLLEQSRLMQRQSREFSHRILNVEENQRKKISRELHDDVSQLLVGINVNLAAFTQEAAINPQDAHRNVAPLRLLVEKSLQTVHRFARELRPSSLDDLGLIPALRSYLAALPQVKGRRVTFTAFAGIEAVDIEIRTVLFRIAQEAVTNAFKHAQAGLIRVSISQKPPGVRLEITDDGKAFDLGRLVSGQWNNRIGLVSMRERVEMVGGTFTILSVPGRGTTIRAEIPTPGK